MEEEEEAPRADSPGAQTARWQNAEEETTTRNICARRLSPSRHEWAGMPGNCWRRAHGAGAARPRAPRPGGRMPAPPRACRWQPHAASRTSSGCAADPGAGRCSTSCRHVSMPGLRVSPERTFHAVVNGTPLRDDKAMSSALRKGANSWRTCSAEGIEIDMRRAYRKRYQCVNPYRVRYSHSCTV